MTSPILVLGGSGQIGHELIREVSSLGTVVAPAHHELDLGSADAIRETMRRVRPAIVINAAGYTAVDAAESDAERCALLNTRAPAVLAEECRALGAWFAHFSTDYVFDGSKGAPYVESDETRPLNVYGRTKLDGEAAIASVGGRFLIFRTSWVYSTRGKNFALMMLRLARERPELRVVDDQIGAPTSARAVASGVALALGRLKNKTALDDAAGVYHMTASGSTTWYGFARTILTDAPWPEQQVCRTLRAITTAEYPTAAKRPAYSVLDNAKLAERFGVRLSPWEDQWKAVARQLRLRAG